MTKGEGENITKSEPGLSISLREAKALDAVLKYWLNSSVSDDHPRHAEIDGLRQRIRGFIDAR